MAAFETETLFHLVRAKHACLVQLHDMGRKQLSLIQDGNMTALLDLLSAKQRPLMDLRRIEAALDPFRDQNPDERRWRRSEDRTACAREVEECESLLREIVAQEKQCEATLTRRRDEAASRLQGLHVAGQARGAYAAPTPAEVCQIDLRVC